jgi:glycosyltransferase involved in cell wall biosynthesis/2-polyprenyl-3-methyl-5-hydroxy-6-metoxy-1,4-benzoquinol methylase
VPDREVRWRLLIFVPTYEAEAHIAQVVDRLPADLADEFHVQVLVLDDASTDGTANAARTAFQRRALPYAWRIFVNAANQGYGGNQKLGYQYAIDNDFDVVVMVHGDGQYPPEEIRPLARLAMTHGAAFGSRLATPGSARRGGMPTYKYIGNRILTSVQNHLLGTQLTEFHSGFRAYRTDVLAEIPFDLNSNDFHFDTEIFIQCVRAGVEIGEMPIPTHYGDEICRVDGMQYAGHVVGQTVRSALHDKGLFYERKYDLDDGAGRYESKVHFASPAQAALERIAPGRTVLDLGSSDGHVARELRTRGCRVIGVDVRRPANTDAFDHFVEWNLDSGLPPIEEQVDVVVLADVIEHLRAPEDFAEQLGRFCRDRGVGQVLVSTGNVAFVVQRLMLLAGQFNYGPRGILDMTHTRLFTARTIRRLFRQAGFRVDELIGIPAPFPLAVGSGRLGQALLRCNELAIRASKTLFSYQLFLALTPPTDLRRLIAESSGHVASVPDARAVSV